MPEATWLAALLELSNVALVGVDLEGKVAYWSKGAETLFGWSVEEIRGQPPPIVPPALEQEWRLQLHLVLETHQPTPPAETQRIGRGGRLITVVRASTPVRNTAGQISGVLDVLVDATALKQ